MATPPDPEDLDVLHRPGANARVIEKKALLAALARTEADRLGITPSAEAIADVAGALRCELELEDEGELEHWLDEIGLDRVALHEVLHDFAAVLAVEAHHRAALAGRVERHRRLAAGWEARLRDRRRPA